MFTTASFFFDHHRLTIGVAYGYSTGSEHVGPVTLGWKGGVGDHVGYLVLIGGAFASACAAGIIVAFRDADPTAQSHYMGVEATPTTPVTGSLARRRCSVALRWCSVSCSARPSSSSAW